MRTVKLAMYVSLDGVVENPAWTGPFWSEDLAAMQNDYLMSSDALLLGRITYEGFAAAWPGMEESTGAFGAKMNAMPKHVASRRLDQTEWNATLLEGDLGEAVQALRAQAGGDLLIYGSGDVVDQLSALGLIDEYRLMVHPVIVATGKRLFAGAPERPLRLTESVTTEGGVAVLTYRDDGHRDQGGN